MGSGDVILCADHPILGQAVIVLHLDYPNCYESQDAFSSGHVECTSLPHRSDVFEFWPCFYKHCNSSPIHSNIGILAPSLQTLEFSPHFYKHWNSGPIHSNTGIPAPSFQTLEFRTCPFELWNSGPVFISIGILVLSFPTFEFCPYLFKQYSAKLATVSNGTRFLTFFWHFFDWGQSLPDRLKLQRAREIHITACNWFDRKQPENKFARN